MLFEEDNPRIKLCRLADVYTVHSVSPKRNNSSAGNSRLDTIARQWIRQSARQGRSSMRGEQDLFGHSKVQSNIIPPPGELPSSFLCHIQYLEGMTILVKKTRKGQPQKPKTTTRMRYTRTPPFLSHKK